MLKSGLAAGISWPIAERVTGVTDPVLAALTALVVVQVSVRASVFNALQRSAAVVLGVVAALVLGDALNLDALSVALLVTVSLAVAELVLRLPRAAARQVPVSGLLVLSTAAIDPGSYGGLRALDTVVGAVVGVIVSLVLPASRLVDSRQTLDRLAGSLGDVLEAMGPGLAEPWTPEQTREWRRTARTARERLVDQAVEAVGNGRESARWNVRDRRHTEELGRYEEVLPRLERTAIGVVGHLPWASTTMPISRVPISRVPTSRVPTSRVPNLEGAAPVPAAARPAMPAMGALLVALGGAVRALVRDVLGSSGRVDLDRAIAEVRTQRQRCVRGASRRARLALEHDAEASRSTEATALEGEWLNYAAILVQVDRIVGDLSAPLPT